MCGWTGHNQGNLPLRVCEAARPSAWFSGKFCPQGNIRGKEFLSRDCAQKWVPPKSAALLRRALGLVSAWAGCYVVDLDDFKQINDTQGHLFGDTVLQSLGRAMREVGRPGDLVGRFGGDEFVLFAQGNISEEGVRRRFERLGDALKEAVPPGCPVSITCSLGIVCASGQGVEYEQLFRQADAALYRAKAMGKNTFCLTRYQPE